jgi:membrane protein implicated in regulation of membrane protease activity
MPIPVIWFVVAVGLLVAEIASTTFYAVFLALGAAAGGVIALIAPDLPLLAQAAVAVIVAVAGVGVVRPFVGRRMHRRAPGAIGPGVHGGFVGQQALALDAIGDELHPGHVRLAGEVWLAITDPHQAIDGGASVVVSAVRGTTLLVRPVGRSPAQPSEA